jgi:protocatechuate 3,4-dioxygenase beta subunit
MLKLVAGSLQTAKLGKAFQTDLQVALANSNGCPLTGSLAGIAVTFVAPGGDASGTYASSGSYVAYAGTDASGIATAPTFTANDTAGSYGVYAESDYGSVRFDLSNTAAGVVASIAATGQTDQAASVNSQYGQPLQVQVLDANGRPVQGVSVSFALGPGATGAGASFLSGGAQASATTKANGQATSPPFVANGSPGRFTATASTSDIPTVATFGLANHAAANTLTETAPAQQRATVDSRYPRPLQARVLDANGQPIEGASVTFTLPSAASGAGASFPGGSSQASALTDTNGQASSPPLLANTTAGRFTATAAVSGIANPLSYPLRNLAGTPDTITAGAANDETPAGSRFPIPLAVTVKDANSNPVPGALVTFTAPAHGPSGHFAARRPARKQTAGGKRRAPARTSRVVRVKTNADGVAVAPPFSANAKPGGYVVTATIAGSRQRAAFALVNRQTSR